MPSPANFNPLARGYRALEFLAFGGDLERARFCLLDRLADRTSILILGEGDGRCLERLLALAPVARIHCVDASSAMLARARARIAGRRGCERVTFTCADALTLELGEARHDAVITLFFLDCFPDSEAAGLVQRIGRSLRPDARWLWADFALPEKGWARFRARCWLTVLYAFFRWQTGLQTRTLPPAEALIAQAGFRAGETREFQHGLLRSRYFMRHPTRP